MRKHPARGGFCRHCEGTVRALLPVLLRHPKPFESLIYPPIEVQILAVGARAAGKYRLVEFSADSCNPSCNSRFHSKQSSGSGVVSTLRSAPNPSPVVLASADPLAYTINASRVSASSWHCCRHWVHMRPPWIVAALPLQLLRFSPLKCRDVPTAGAAVVSTVASASVAVAAPTAVAVVVTAGAFAVTAGCCCHRHRPTRRRPMEPGGAFRVPSDAGWGFYRRRYAHC